MRRGKELIDGTKELILPLDSLIEKSVWVGVITNQIPYVLDDKLDMEDVWNQVIKSITGKGRGSIDKV